MELSHITFLAFAFFSSLRVVSYLPQIIKVASDINGASAISYSTWALWTAANIATALYATFNLSDLYLAAVSAIYATCCVVVILITAMKRRLLKGRGVDHSGSAEHSMPVYDARFRKTGSPRLLAYIGRYRSVL
jgi:hypothetical protein